MLVSCTSDGLIKLWRWPLTFTLWHPIRNLTQSGLAEHTTQNETVTYCTFVFLYLTNRLYYPKLKRQKWINRGTSNCLAIFLVLQNLFWSQIKLPSCSISLTNFYYRLAKEQQTILQGRNNDGLCEISLNRPASVFSSQLLGLYSSFTHESPLKIRVIALWLWQTMFLIKLHFERGTFAFHANNSA